MATVDQLISQQRRDELEYYKNAERKLSYDFTNSFQFYKPRLDKFNWCYGKKEVPNATMQVLGFEDSFIDLMERFDSLKAIMSKYKIPEEDKSADIKDMQSKIELYLQKGIRAILVEVYPEFKTPRKVKKVKRVIRKKGELPQLTGEIPVSWDSNILSTTYDVKMVDFDPNTGTEFDSSGNFKPLIQYRTGADPAKLKIPKQSNVDPYGRPILSSEQRPVRRSNGLYEQINKVAKTYNPSVFYKPEAEAPIVPNPKQPTPHYDMKQIQMLLDAGAISHETYYILRKQTIEQEKNIIK